jgi:glycosyltransferase involved in cell wall biosynthesis
MVSSFVTGLQVRDVDLVWGTSPPIFQGATTLALARLKQVRYLFEVRDLWPEFAVAVGVLRQPLLIQMSEWLERFLYSRADTVLVNSPGFIQHVQTRGARHVELVPNGADTEMFDPAADSSRFRAQYALEGKYIALYAGAHGISNDLGTLLEAACLLKDDARIAVVLVGDGKEKPALIRKAAELGLENVIFVPPISKAEMPSVLAAADACVAILLPLEAYKTVYPNKVFDYMAAGRPVILAIDGVIREVVEAAEAGIAVPPGDAYALAQALRRFANDPQQGLEMGARGRSYVTSHFNRSTLAERLETILVELQGE